MKKSMFPSARPLQARALLLSTSISLLMVSGIAQATDLQIYASPTAGKKTIIMMLDTSGSMGAGSIDIDYGVNCSDRGEWVTDASGLRYERRFCTINGVKSYDRLSRLKDGMFAFLNSNNGELVNVRVGVGNFSADGDDNTGQILVPAAELGASSTANDSTTPSQRYKLKQAIARLSATSLTPSAHAYAEAAAYLMGTSSWHVFPRIAYRRQGNFSYYYERCTGWTGTLDSRGYERCAGYEYLGSLINPPVSGATYAYSDRSYDYYLEPGTITNTGIVKSKNKDANQNQIMIDDTAANSALQYRSPLPPPADRASCDGQGVYFLSDGVPNNSSNLEAAQIMRAALNDNNFVCSGGTPSLPNINSDTGWTCMGKFAQALYNKTKNPSGTVIKTAFVGFGKDFNNVSASDDVLNACRLSSTSDQTACNATMPAGSFGNGGFFPASTKDDVTTSVVSFIKNLGDVPIEPLSTGSISIPFDPLNPDGFQNYGYLRMINPEPQNLKLIWDGNLKKYQTASGLIKDRGNAAVFDNNGALVSGTTDFWNTGSGDGGKVNEGGAYSRVPMPTTADTTKLRPFFSDIASVTSGTVNPSAAGSNLQSLVPAVTLTNPPSNNILTKFNSTATADSPLKDLPLAVKRRILNYFGYDNEVTDSTSLPSASPTNPPYPNPTERFLAMGGSIHSLPVQLTYSGNLDPSTGDLTSTRAQSLMYGTTDGGLHIVDGTSGTEQMVFVPEELLDSPNGNALRKGEAGAQLSHGMDGPWVADADYDVNSDGTQIAATRMNVYGGLRMGGSSYYGLDVTNLNAPKLKFRIGAGSNSNVSGYTRMGQTWSRPNLANIRHGGTVKRVMIVGAGYDTCYENPRFGLNTTATWNVTDKDQAGTSCSGKTEALGNAVYLVDADSGAKLAEVTYSSGDDRQYLKHSVVSQIATLDREGDGLVDHLYFGDLGGQAFRVDLNNASGTSTANLVKRVTRVLDLSTPANGGYTTAGDQPRFYETPTLTIHDEGANTFILMALASGDRSTPLDVYPTIGREKMKPTTAVANRPTNKVYGVLDRDFVKTDLITGTPTLISRNITVNNMQANPQTLSGNLVTRFFPTSGTAKLGWYRSLSSNSAGTELATGGTRTPGGLKAFENLVAVGGNLFVSVYDPEGTGIATQDPCQPRVVGETDLQRYCLPYGACVDKATGVVDSTREAGTGFVITAGKNANVLGRGIQGANLGNGGPGAGGSGTGGSCSSLTVVGNTGNKGRWDCNRRLVPTRWFQKNAQVN